MNQRPSNTQAGILIVEDEHQRQPARVRVEHELGAEDASIAPLAPSTGTSSALLSGMSNV